MNDLLKQVRDQLAQELNQIAAPKLVIPTYFDVYVASSGLQKAIRRGQLTVALQCTARLLQDDPARFWRRLVTIAFEDVGIGNLEIVSRVVFSGDRAWRESVGGDWTVAARLVEVLCSANKDRTADEIVVLCQLQSGLEGCRRRWASEADHDLAARLATSMPLESAALAAWYLAGTKRYRSPKLAARITSVRTIWDTYQALGFERRTAQISEKGSSRGGEILAVLFPLICRAFRMQTARIEEIELRAAPILGDLPSYVFDAFTRDGLRAIAHFVDISKPWKKFLSRHVQQQSWKSVTADVLFRAESELTSRRVRWDTGDRVIEEARQLIPGLPSLVADEGIALLTEELCLMDLARHEAITRRTSNPG